MAKETYLYEVLIRGKIGGKISGAHMIYMDRYTMDDGQVIEQPRGAEPIDIDAIGSLLGKEMAAAAAQVASLTAERDAVTVERDTMRAAIRQTLATLQSTAEQTFSEMAAGK